MTITSTGYSAKRYQDIIAELRQALITASGDPNLDLSDDSLLGVINNIYGLQLSELHDLAQALWSSGDVDTAEGLALDRLVARARITRLIPVKSYGNLYYTANIGSIIAANTRVKDLSGAVVATTNQIVLDSTGIRTAYINVSVVNNFNYSLSVNGTSYNYLSDATATFTEIVNGLTVALSSNTNLVVSSSGSQLIIDAVNSNINLITGTNLTVAKVTKIAPAIAEEFGENEFEAFTLNILVNPNPAITVTNRDNWITGRSEETDAELRLRFKSSVGGQGNATVEAIRSKLQAVTGVIKASVEHNTSLVTNANGLPAKSFEATVKGGSNLEVATTIWNTQPAGIEPFGNTSQNITDSEGNTQTIFFTRPIDQYIHCIVTYTLYNEEIFPVDGVSQIANAVNEYGTALGLGEDVFAQRVMSAIYNKVAGIGNLVVQIGKTAAPNDSPVYTTTVVPIGRKEESVFDLSRISVVAA